MLVAAAEKDAIVKGRHGMRLEVRADDRGALGLYETSGYGRCGLKPGYYGRVAAVLFEKPLGKKPGRKKRVQKELRLRS